MCQIYKKDGLIHENINTCLKQLCIWLKDHFRTFGKRFLKSLNVSEYLMLLLLSASLTAFVSAFTTLFREALSPHVPSISPVAVSKILASTHTTKMIIMKPRIYEKICFDKKSLGEIAISPSEFSKSCFFLRNFKKLYGTDKEYVVCGTNFFSTSYD